MSTGHFLIASPTLQGPCSSPDGRDSRLMPYYSGFQKALVLSRRVMVLLRPPSQEDYARLLDGSSDSCAPRSGRRHDAGCRRREVLRQRLVGTPAAATAP